MMCSADAHGADPLYLACLRKVADFVRNLILEAIEERERKAGGDHERA
jgi:hypothetical protein